MSKKTETTKWVAHQYSDGLGSFKVVAISPDRQRSITVGHLTKDEADNFDGAAEWAARKSMGIKGVTK